MGYHWLIFLCNKNKIKIDTRGFQKLSLENEIKVISTMSTVIRQKKLLPKKSYLDVVSKESVQLNTPLKNQLLILDLNGTLVSRSKTNKSMYARPYSRKFFDYIFDNFRVMLWSSAQPHSVKFMSRIFGQRKEKLLVSWDRTNFGLSKADYSRKVTTIKDLDKVWSYFKGEYDPTNTIMLDDSPIKAQLQPYNCVHPTEFEHLSQAFVSSGECELLHVMDYLKKLQFQTNVSNYMKHHPYDGSHQSSRHKKSYKVKFYNFHNDSNERGESVNLQPKQKTENVMGSLTNKVVNMSL